MKRTAIFMPLLLVAWSSFAQVFDYSSTCSFTSLAYTDGVGLLGDTGLPYAFMSSPSGLHWIPNSVFTIRYPYAYVSGNAAKLTIKFKTTCSSTYYIKGDGPGSYDFPAQQGPTSGSGTPPTLSMTFTCSTSFPLHRVQSLEKFAIDWYYSQDQVNWVKVATTSSPIYVLWEAPLPTVTTGLTSHFHTLVQLGCKNADGLTNKTAIVNAIYADFQDKQVFGVSHPIQPFTYYSWLNVAQPINQDFDNSFTAACPTLSSVLDPTVFGATPFNGRCGSFAEMLHDILEIQGIDCKIIALNWKQSTVLGTGQIQTATATAQTTFGTSYFHSLEHFGTQAADALFFVNNWAWTSLIGGSQPNTYHLIRPTGTSQVINGVTYLGKDTDGVAGQGPVSNPWSIFGDHGMVYYEDSSSKMILDPSYGSAPVSVPISSTNDELVRVWELGALAGFGAVAWIKTSPNPPYDTYPFAWYGEENTSVKQIEYYQFLY